MKLGIMSTGPTLEHYLAAQARRSRYFLIVDLDTMQYLAFQNPIHIIHGPAAGRLFAQVLVQNSVDTILAGSFDPVIRKMLCKAGVQVASGKQGIVYKIIESFKRSYYP
jgi:predicted Fe-Mo cluster-binding NifX family protein